MDSPARDGYQAQRSYSIASEPERSGEIDLTVERLEDGEVSSYLHDVLVVGDQVTGYARRIDHQMLSEVARLLGGTPRTFIRGPTPLVEAVANAAVEIGIRPDSIRTERFGPTGTTR